MLIQVHDELIFEVPESEVELIKVEVPKIMTGSHQNFLKLDVPIRLTSVKVIAGMKLTKFLWLLYEV